MFEELDLNSVNIPEKCKGCGIQCESAAELGKLLLRKKIGLIQGEALVGEEGQAVDELIDDLVPEELSEVVKKGIRQELGESLEYTDEEIETIKQDMRANELSCEGVLKMRATKGDVSYMVNVCTSARVYTRDAQRPQHVPVHIWAKSINQAGRL